MYLFQNSMPVEVTEGVTDPQSLYQLIESTLDPLLSLHYHTSNSRECMGVNGEALQLHSVYKKPHFFYASHARICIMQCCKSQVTQESVSVLQVTRESVSGTASHARCIWNEVRMIKSLSPLYQAIPEKNITRLLPLALLVVLHTRNNTDGNKLVIFSFLYIFVLW